MPSRGSISATCVPEATEEVRRFALHLKTFILHILPGAAMAEKAHALRVSPSLLSHWLHGRRLPRLTALKEMAALALEGMPVGQEAAIREDFVRLEALLQQARRSSCRRCEGDCACRDASSEGDRRNSQATSSSEGDRRNDEAGGTKSGESHSPSSSSQTGLPSQLTGLPLADRAAFLWGLGTTLSAREIGTAARALAHAHMHEEMEIILRSAESAGRDPVEIALTIGGVH